jgi:hypothetical protein
MRWVKLGGLRDRPIRTALTIFNLVDCREMESSPADVEQQQLFTEVNRSLGRGQMRKAEKALDERT